MYSMKVPKYNIHLRLNMIKRYKELFFCTLILTTSHSFSQSINGAHFVPRGALILQVSTGDELNEKSSILGFEGSYNFNPDSNYVFGGIFGYQKQDYGTFSEDRFSIGLSVNRYFETSGNASYYAGVKWLFYTGMGNTEEALDCLYCSDIDESYSGNNAFLAAGLISRNWLFGIEYLLTSNTSEFNLDAYDPWGVGSNYDYDYEGIPDPKLILNIGYAF